MKFPLPNKKSVLAVAALLAISIIAVACATNADEYPEPVFIESQDCDDLNHGLLPVTDLTLSTDGLDIPIQVEIADVPSEREQGFMCRESIPPGTGMLFIYNADRDSGFWMYNTYVPIDILHIDSFGRVVDKIEMSPCPRNGADDDDWRVMCATESAIYTPMRSWRYALELPAGWLADEGVGDPIFLNMTVSWSDLDSDQ